MIYNKTSSYSTSHLFSLLELKKINFVYFIFISHFISIYFLSLGSKVRAYIRHDLHLIIQDLMRSLRSPNSQLYIIQKYERQNSE